MEISERYALAVAQWQAVVDEILRLSAENEELREPIKDTYACKKCGRRDGLDCVIPNHLWNEVQEETGCSVLCAWCLDDHLFEKGIEVRALLAFVGKAINASTDPLNDDAHWEQHLRDLTGRCSAALDESARARAEGRLEGMRKAVDLAFEERAEYGSSDISLGEIIGTLNEAIAAAERELAGEENA